MSFDKTKTNVTLGIQVHDYLAKCGVETPMVFGRVHSHETNSNIINEIANHYKQIMQLLDLDLTDDSLQDTPKRVGKMYVNEIFYGLDYANFPKITPFENKMQYDEMLVERKISVKSMCEHHLMPFIGECSFAYIPKDKVLGLSKINRVVDFFSRRPQVQERLTEQIYHALSFILNTPDIAVVIKAKHLCVIQRGIEDVNSDTVTSKLGGTFKNNVQVRNEFLKLIEI